MNHKFIKEIHIIKWFHVDKFKWKKERGEEKKNEITGRSNYKVIVRKNFNVVKHWLFNVYLEVYPTTIPRTGWSNEFWKVLMPWNTSPLESIKLHQIKTRYKLQCKRWKRHYRNLYKQITLCIVALVCPLIWQIETINGKL